MTALEQALIRLSGDLRALGVRWALVGGMAVSFRAEPRTTQDVDVTIAVSGDQEAERIARDLTMRGYRPLESQPFLENLDGRLNAVRLLAPTAVGLETIGVDLLFGSSGVEEEVVAAAEVREVAIGLYVPVARIGHLIALKVLAGRDKDRADVRSLLQEATLEDVRLARESLDRIERRGFHRGKDLQAELARLLVPEG
ncbi:MAG TPA: nucleotidyl transferase AbiEii/AbiGii toxin family protein [Thermoanaerobaculia bacterium]|nr:nucleotidyl transferase AbiEii/AbiGii toxin family protein [Thermoanaerobaculia bacterium]